MFNFFGIYVLLTLIITSSFVHGNQHGDTDTDTNTTCHYIFGDSLFEAGNNNNLNTIAKANYAPYGIDFPPGNNATGRFTNGQTMADFITTLVGIQGFIQAFTNASGPEIVKGVNYASGSGGLRPESGAQLGDRIPFSDQVSNHVRTIVKLPPFVRGPVSEYLKKCLFTVNIGSNDYINNYFMPQFYPSKSMYTPDQFATLLVREYSQQLRRLYVLGARKTAIFGLGLIGCTPAEIAMNNATQCVQEINQAVVIFNQKLRTLVDNLNDDLSRANFTYIDTIAIQSAAPLPPGVNVTGTCCQALRSDFQCVPNVPPCPDRTVYVFMDGYHPTEVFNNLTAIAAYDSPNSTFVHPVDINTLVSS